MPRQNATLFAFNRGEVDKRALARIDVERLALAAERQVNWMPRVLGSMMVRPGTQYLLNTKSNNPAKYIPFNYAIDDQALIEITHTVIRVIIDDVPLTRATVLSAFTNGTFISNLSSWAETNDDVNCNTTWAGSGNVKIVGSGTGKSRLSQDVTRNGTNEHAIRFQVYSGQVDLKVTDTASGFVYFDYNLAQGVHSLAFTPSGDFTVEISSDKLYESFFSGIAIEPAGVMELPGHWFDTNLPYIRYDQLNDVIYVTCKGRPMRKIERRSRTSWSSVDLFPKDGPFGEINATPTTIAADQLDGDVNLTATSSIFKSGQTGGLLKLTSAGQVVQEDIGADDTFTESIRVIGVGATRNFTVNIADTWDATVTLQRSDDDATWVDVSLYTTNTAVTYNDGLDNQTAYYRIGVKTSAYTSGNANVKLSYASGSIDGIVQLTTVNGTTATARVLKKLGGTAATADWYEGLWYGDFGYPTAVAVYEDRLWLAGKGKICGSVAGQYYGTLESFDQTVEGDSGVIIRDVNGGYSIKWLLALNRLMIGTSDTIKSCRSTSFDEPLTPSNFNVKNASTYGAADIAPSVVDDAGIYVNSTLLNINQLNFDGRSFDYLPSDINPLNPDIGAPGVVGIAVQRTPDTRIHVWLTDGTVVVMVNEPAEEVSGWVRVELDGLVEGVVIQPGLVEDKVYYVVNRGGSRMLCKWAKESEAVGGAINKMADLFVYSSGSSSTITGLNHLNGASVVAWGNGKYQGTFTVSGGSITLPETCTHRCAGLPYTAQYKSSKLAYAAGLGTALAQKKKISQLGLIMADCHAQGVKYGSDFTTLYDLPKKPNWMPIDQNSISSQYDEEMFPFDGEWSTDSRLCLQGQAPFPCTILAAVISVQTNDKV